MSVQISGSLQQAQGTGASSAAWQALLDQLSSDIAQGVPFPGLVLLNEDGSFLLHYRISDIASFVHGGGVWVDYCTWPMKTDISSVLGIPYPFGAGGFAAFAQDTIGSPLSLGADDPQFSPPLFSGLHVPGGLSNALFTTQNLGNTPGIGLPVGFTALPYTPPLATQPYKGATAYIAPMFSISYGKGYYFYACGEPTGSRSIHPSVYSAFITTTIGSPSSTFTSGTSNAPAPKTKKSSSSLTSALVKAAEYTGMGLGLLVVGAAVYDYKLHEVSATRVEVVEH